jgi:aminopeptidase N
MFFLFLLSFLSFSAHALPLPKPRPYDAHHYRISLRLDPAADLAEFQAEMEMEFQATGPLSEVLLDREDLVVLQAADLPNGKTLLVDTKDPKTLKIRLAHPLRKGNKGHLRIRYTGKIREEHQGFFKVTDPDEPERGPLFFTTLEPDKARAFFPCNDTPHDKATTEIIASVPSSHETVSNGRLVLSQTKKEGERTKS